MTCRTTCVATCPIIHACNRSIRCSDRQRQESTAAHRNPPQSKQLQFVILALKMSWNDPEMHHRTSRSSSIHCCFVVWRSWVQISSLTPARLAKVISSFFNALTSVATPYLNPLNPELNPICYLLALLAHHFFHVSRIRVKSLTLRLLMSYIYGAPILDVSRSHTTTQHSR